MSDPKKYKIFNLSDCISEQMMFDYIDHKLSAKERNTVEKHLLDCELCSDAMEGLEILKNRNLIEIVNQKINERIIPVVNEKKIISINYKTITAIAAGLIVLIGSVFFFKQFTSNLIMEQKSIADLKTTTPPPSPITEDKSNAADLTQTINSSGTSEVLSKTRKEDSHTNPPTSEKTDATATTPLEKTKTSISDETINNDMTKILAEEKNATVDELKKEDIGTSDKDGYSMAAPAATKNAPESISSKESTKSLANTKKARSESKEKDEFAKEQQENIKSDELVKTQPMNLSNTNDSIYTVVDEMPQFPGGEVALLKHVQKNTKIAATTNKNEESETIYVQFIIDLTGKAIDPKLLKPQSREIEKQVIEMVNKMPLWKPGKNKGEFVSVQYLLPVKVVIK